VQYLIIQTKVDINNKKTICKMKIETKQPLLNNKIDNLHQDIESLNEQLVILKAELNEKNDAYYNNIFNTYEKNIIYKSIEDFYTMLNDFFRMKFNYELTENSEMFKEDFYRKLIYSPVENIIKSMKFKHNKLLYKVGVWLSALLMLGLGSLIFYLSSEYCMEYETSFVLNGNDKWEYTTFGLCLNLIAGLSCLIGLIMFSASSILNSNEVVSLIESEENRNFNELINYLNSIHKLPNDVKDLIK
jgi:hypothetical protein